MGQSLGDMWYTRIAGARGVRLALASALAVVLAVAGLTYSPVTPAFG